MNQITRVLRVIDANSNRAREALRVMEDFARFVLDDSLLTESCKELRHELAAHVRALEGSAAQGGAPADMEGPRTGEGGVLVEGTAGAGAERSAGTPRRGELLPSGMAGLLPATRDIVGDAGREVTAAGEFVRADAGQAALAAGKRLSEALRSSEEYAKTLDQSVAAGIEGLRYRGYELERRLGVSVLARERFGGVRLYVILTEALCRRGWFETAEAVLEGGADCLQLREKDLSDRELLGRVRRLAALCRGRGKLLLVNDRADIAVAGGAHGVHVGQDDLPVWAVRRALPPWCIVGKSTHTIEQVRRAAAEAPDYLAVGPMFPTSTKPQDCIAGVTTLAGARSLTGLPLVAIGGIDAIRAPEVLAAGPVCLCVCRAVIGSADAAEAARRMRNLVDSDHGVGRGLIAP